MEQHQYYYYNNDDEKLTEKDGLVVAGSAVNSTLANNSDLFSRNYIKLFSPIYRVE